MADLNGSYQELLDSGDPIDSLVNKLNPGYAGPLGVPQNNYPEDGSDIIAWAQSLGLDHANPATELSQPLPSPLDRSLYLEDAPYEPEPTRYHSAFSFEDHSQLYTGPSDELYAAPYAPYPGFVHSNSLQIDPQLIESGIADIELFPGLFDTPETNMFLPLEPEQPSPSLRAESSSVQPRKLKLRVKKNVNPTDNTNSKITKSKGKQRAVTSRSSASPILTPNLSSIVLPKPRGRGIGAGNSQGAGGSDGCLHPVLQDISNHREPIDLHTQIYATKDQYPDSDDTVELEDYNTPFHSRSSSGICCISDYLANAPAAPQANNDNTVASPGDSDHAQNQDGEAGNRVTKKRRGRPIVPGSKRQRRIIAMSKPDYVPPKRGRPRTSERHRKRSRRAKVPFKKPIQQPLGNVPEDEIVIEEEDKQETYTPIDINDELGYKPVYYILSVAQAEKVRQLYGIPAPRQGWSQEERWRLTFNLCRITPTGETLRRMITERASNYSSQNKENYDPDHLGTDTVPDDEQGESRDDIFSRPNMPPKPIFPDYRLQVVVDGAQREMSLGEVLHKLNDERDVLFRAIVWGIYNGHYYIDDMEFIGQVNKTTKTWEFF
ncbi:hypothetical protein AA313_de0202747 [Arthrobotrys entomopaga]|nr:hypothetical protein AA313_de0202747 [Arthrobotrys entomopaga]